MSDWSSDGGRRKAAERPQLVWYLGSRLPDGTSLTDDMALKFAESSGGAVLRGDRGYRQGMKLRQLGFDGRLWLDPAQYDPRAGVRPVELFDPWQIRQDHLRAEERISPGTLVDEDATVDDLCRAIENEMGWVATMGGGRCSLVLHASWLAGRVDSVLPRLEDCRGRLALTVAGGRDPLGRPGAVEGLVHLVRAVPDVFLLRSDLGAIGAVANGASMGALGTAASVRHFVPDGENPGRSSDRSPPVFVADMLDFMKGSKLDSFPRSASPTCDLPCCDGRELRRFNRVDTAQAATDHNRQAFGAVAATVLKEELVARANAFRAMCVDAVTATERLSIQARREVTAKAQLRAWARLGSTSLSAADRPTR